MASVSKDSKGWRIVYYSVDGRQRTLRPGKQTNKKTAEQIGANIDRLVAAKAADCVVDLQVSKWLGNIGDALHQKLVRAELAEPRNPKNPEPEPEPAMTLKAFLADHMEHGRTASGRPAAPATLVKWRPTQKYLNERFPDRVLESITAEDAHQFRVWLDNRRIKQKTAGRKGQPMTENAKRRHIATCKTFFNAAKRRGLIQFNPFESQVSGSTPNRSRDFYITPESTLKLLDSTTDPQWRLLIALWRLAGLRKMEVFKLKWGDVLWTEGKLRVHAPKTAHIDGGEVRYTPIRDAREFLEDAFQAALAPRQKSLPAEQPIIDRFSASNSNIDKPFRKLVLAAGLVPWPKLFQNLRASCETQWLKEGIRPDLVANWMGHSVAIQRKNYVQETSEDIEAFNSLPKFGGNTGGNNCGRIGENRVELAASPNSRLSLKNKANAAISASKASEANNPTRT